MRAFSWSVALVVLALIAGPARAEPVPSGATSLAEVEAFAKGLEKSLTKGDSTPLADALDIDAMLVITQQGVEAPQEFLDGFRQGASGTARQSLLQAWRTWLPPSRADVVRVSMVDGRPRALFRVVSEEGAFSYSALVVTGRPGGGLRIVDVWMAATGELMSETLRATLRDIVSRLSAGAEGQKAVAGLTGDTSALQLISALVQGGKPREALDEWARLSESSKTMRHVALLRVMAATQLGDAAELDAALAHHRRLFPTDAALNLFLIDDSINKRKWDVALAAIDGVDQAVGGDPYLSIQRANTCVLAERWADVTTHAKKAADAGVEVEQAHWLLVTSSLRREDHVETARLLGFMETKLGIELADLRGVEDYAGFVKSEPGRAFVGKRWPGP